MIKFIALYRTILYFQGATTRSLLFHISPLSRKALFLCPFSKEVTQNVREFRLENRS